jgi:hypothetical protein
MTTSLGFVSTLWNNVLEKLQEFIDGRIHQMNFGFLCRTYLKGYLNRCQMEEVNECLIYQKQESVAIEFKFGDWKTFQN